jgi:diacylglycerol O-acyltransferase
MNEFMRNTDAFALGMEDDARLRSTIVSIVVLGRSPDWEALVDRFERVSRLVPMFRQRVVPSLPPAPPRWVYDQDFDLRYHVDRVNAPAPGGLTTLLDMGRRAMMEEFDHARPMWHITLVENLADGGAALVVKLHHALADGLGGVQIAQLIVDLEPVRRDLGPLPPVPRLRATDRSTRSGTSSATTSRACPGWLGQQS